ncbi:MAG TPA: ion channel [Terriglobales bacterium]|nr:ion channel [Terriglobales bacterium]
MNSPAANPKLEVPQDLGFGTVVTEQRHFRLLNRDGSFNVRRTQHRVLPTLGSYHVLLTISWPRFFALFISLYLLANTLFALGYELCGPDALQSTIPGGHFFHAFFFSVETFSTIGYGNIIPVGVAANVLVLAESICALIMFGVGTGLVFSRFARPVAAIGYSEKAVIAPYRGITAFEFRVVNLRSNQLVNVQAEVIFSRFEDCAGGIRQRRFHSLALERRMVTFFPLNWTLVHPIDESSPLYGWTKQMMFDAEVEFFVLLTAVDETFAQTVHSRSSYSADEVEFGAQFVRMYEAQDREMFIDMKLLSKTERVSIEIPRQLKQVERSDC